MLTSGPTDQAVAVASISKSRPHFWARNHALTFCLESETECRRFSVTLETTRRRTWLSYVSYTSLHVQKDDSYSGRGRPVSYARLTHFLHLSVSSVILIDSFTGCPVHVLMLVFQATPLFPHGVTIVCAATTFWLWSVDVASEKICWCKPY